MADLTFDCPECSHELIVDAQASGMVVACPECGTKILVPNPEDEPEETPAAGAGGVPVKLVGSRADAAAVPESAPEPAVAPAPEMVPTSPALEYKVVSLLEGDGEAGKITADAVEFKLNELLSDGWTLRSATTVHTRDWLGNPKQELLLIVERRI